MARKGNIIVEAESFLLSSYGGHRLNMELDLQSLFGLLCTAVLTG
jgi:hypothetical protein